MVKMNYSELKTRFIEAETDNKHITGCIVFKNENMNGIYSLASRTYAVSSNNKAFQSGKLGYSIFGSSLDGSDEGVRLDYYMAEEKGGKSGWIVDYCYLEDSFLVS